MPSLVSRFHDAAVSPEAWPEALKALTDAARVAGAATSICDESRTEVSTQGSRFYFHVDNCSRYPDETGSVFSTAEDAKAHALVLARELATDEGWNGSFILVTDDRGQEIIRVRIGQ
jgi:hypothetical protein